MAAAINVSCGEERYNAKLTEDDVRLIILLGRQKKRLLAEAKKLSNMEIARKFEVSKSTIEGIINGAKWKHMQTIREQDDEKHPGQVVRVRQLGVDRRRENLRSSTAGVAQESGARG